jgi:hypothetical protein
MKNDKETVKWLNECDPIHTWKVAEDVFCMHCECVFKAEDVIEDDEGDPNCPMCRHSSPIDFHKEPWWRPDLTEQSATKYRVKSTWIVEPIRATPGQPTPLPPRKP